MIFRILIVDDEPEVCSSLSEILSENGYTVDYRTDPTLVAAYLLENQIDLMLLDIRMPGIGGLDLLEEIRSSHPDLGIIVISGFATVEHAVKAMKYGAVNLLTKPLKISLLLLEIEQYRNSLSSKSKVTDEYSIVTEDPSVLHIVEQVKVAASTPAPVLIQGESGTGKELIAEMLHRNSRRAGNPLTKINCAAIPEHLLESELFGYEKGAFTDAKENKTGLLEYADKGTVFLDEIGEMSIHTQAKILRVLQDKKFTRVGGLKPVSSDFRVIAATNKNLKEEVALGNFRKDLYYRLTVVEINMPPLRERTGDIMLLVNHFIDYFNSVYEKNIRSIGPEAQKALEQHIWPGNIRELKNVIERAVIFSPGNTIDLSCLPEQYRCIFHTSPTEELNNRYDSISREIILEALSRSNGVRQEAARLLHISRKTLYNRMRRLNIQ